ncbi:unnamed protein product [Discosporangium mesarthrocarpum]
MAFPVFLFLCVVVGGPYLYLGWEHLKLYGGVNLCAQGLLLFLCINFLICLWELCLCYRYDLIRSTHLKRKKDGNEDSIPIIIFQNMGLRDVLSPTFWADIWTDYARFDDGYADSKSFGYCIDVGNGHSTLLPNLFLMLSMIQPLTGAKFTGIVGLMCYYQMFYGTVIYLYSFFNNQRHKRLSKSTVLGFVVMPNALWLVFPFIGILNCIQLIMEDSYSVWQGDHWGGGTVHV